jgi:hypothetical protein
MIIAAPVEDVQYEYKAMKEYGYNSRGGERTHSTILAVQVNDLR